MPGHQGIAVASENSFDVVSKVDPQELEKIYLLRAALADLSPQDAMNLLLGRMKKTNSNIEFLLSMKD